MEAKIRNNGLAWSPLAAKALALLLGLWVLLPTGTGAMAQSPDADATAAAAVGRVKNQMAGQGALGRIVERTPGALSFVPRAETLVLSITNPDRIAAAAVGPQLRVFGELDARAGAVRVRDYEIELSLPTPPPPDALGAAASTLLASRSLLAGNVRASLQRFADRINEALRPGAIRVEDKDRDGQGPIATEDRLTTARLANLYDQAVVAGDAPARRAAVVGFANMRQQLKAIYGTYDNYPPWSYAQIRRNANAVVAIGVPGADQAICSGVLVGQGLVLTAGHCFKSDLPEELEVWFDFVEEQDGVRVPQVRRITGLVAPSRDKRDAFFDQAFDADLYDYAIVRFEKAANDQHEIPLVSLPSCLAHPADSPPQGAAPEAHAQWQAVRAEWQARCIRRPQCLRQTRIRRGRPLYVVGYPRGTRETVHDNGRVYLPYQLTRIDFAELKMEIEADYLEHPERDRILAQFTDSYVLNDRKYFLKDVRYGGQPKMGIVADTFQGNSGSPVYDRAGHCLVGMLIGGAEDTGQRLLASWQHHESVLPVSAILDDLRSHRDTQALLQDGVLQIQ
ncbi:MAG: trypsin-like serine protease [Alphaproteobacteria bacterium]|nr:trypsin-like serine protease [Alphaproteobacteria bacterium]